MIPVTLNVVIILGFLALGTISFRSLLSFASPGHNLFQVTTFIYKSWAQFLSGHSFHLQVLGTITFRSLLSFTSPEHNFFHLQVCQGSDSEEIISLLKIKAACPIHEYFIDTTMFLKAIVSRTM